MVNTGGKKEFFSFSIPYLISLYMNSFIWIYCWVKVLFPRCSQYIRECCHSTAVCLGGFFLVFIFLFFYRVLSSYNLPCTALFFTLLLAYNPLQTPRDQLEQIRLELVHPSAAISAWTAPGLNRCLLWLSTTVLAWNRNPTGSLGTIWIIEIWGFFQCTFHDQEELEVNITWHSNNIKIAL